MTGHAGAIVSDAVEEDDPRAIGMRGANDPTAKRDGIGGAHGKILAHGADTGETGIGFTNQIRTERGGGWDGERQERQASRQCPPG